MEDLISRQDAYKCLEFNGEYDTLNEAYERLQKLPSVKPQEKTGHWIEKDGYDGDTYYDCSVCDESWTTIEGTPWNNGMKYCPNCGAKMD